MSAARTPILWCDGDGCANRNIPESYRARTPFPCDTIQSLRREAQGNGWLRQGCKDLCPACSGAHEWKTCACGRAFRSVDHRATQCRTCSGESLPARSRTLEDQHADELRAIRGL